MRFTAWTLTALFFAAGAASASDDMTVVSKTTLDGKPSGTTTNYLSSDHSRMKSGRHDMIIDLKAGTMTTIDNDKKTYYTVTKKDMEEFNAKMKERMNSPEAKKGMQAMQGMAAGMAASYEVKKTGVTRKVGAYTCEEWAITMSAMSTMKECVTSEVKYSAHTYEAFRVFGESMRGSSPFAPIAKSGESLAEKMKAIKGFPVASSTSSDIMGNKTTTESEVVEINHDSIPASTWEVPAGYTKVENPMLKAFERHGGTHD
jgi:hypothetical protein